MDEEDNGISAAKVGVNGELKMFGDTDTDRKQRTETTFLKQVQKPV